jgi:hypothetical protein
MQMSPLRSSIPQCDLMTGFNVSFLRHEIWLPTHQSWLFRRSENRDARSRRAPLRLVLTRGQGLPARRHPPGHPSRTLVRSALRLSQDPVRWCGGGVGCCVDPPYHVVLAVKVCVSAGALPCALRSSSNPDRCAAT